VNERAKTGRLSVGVKMALVGAGVLVLAAGGYTVLVKPKREEAARVEAQVAAVEREIADRRSASTARQVKVAVKAADLFRLAKAVPSDTGMASIILELNSVASDAGILFDSITPDAPVAENGYYVQPISVAFTGNFFSLNDFLFRLRQLVQVHDGRLGVTGRLFVVNSVSFSEPSEQSFPLVTADLDISAFIVGELPGAAPAPAEGSTETSTTSTTDTTSTTQTEPAPSSSGGNAAPPTSSPSS
jgi:hypothetical protein